MKNLKKRIEKDNRGFSLLLVIVAMSVVALLIAVVLMVALQNYQMKVTGLQSENNFYSAEQVIDEIKAGLQEDMSVSVSDAYSYVMEHYSETDGQDGLRNWYFKTQYVDNLYNILSDSKEAGTYNLDILKGYIVQGKGSTVVDSLAEPEEGIKITYSDGSEVQLLCAVANEAAGIDEDGSYVESVKALESNYDTGVTLKGLVVRFTNAKGLLSVISTDLVLGIPAINFTQTESSPDLFSYCIIGENGIKVEENIGSTVSLEGDVYAGSVLVDRAKLKVTAQNYMIVKDDITVNGDSTTNNNFVYNDGALWTNGITLNSADISLNGTSYVRDDLTLNGYESAVEVSGKYYGYSNATMLGEVTDSTVPSSAIIVNGRDSVIDFSSLSELLLAGNAYINIGSSMNLGESEENDGYFMSDTTNTIRMGESIAVKSNQLAYLAPASAIVVNNGEIVESGNPVLIKPNQEADGTYKQIGVYLNTNKSLKELGGKTLKQLGINTGDCQQYIVRQNEETEKLTVYVYMKMNQEQAAKYFKARYGSSLEEYAKIYLPSGVEGELSNLDRLDINGNIMNDASYNLIDDRGELNSQVQSEVDDYYHVFQALTKKLISKYSKLTNDEINGTVFSNIVDVVATVNGDQSISYTFADKHGLAFANTRLDAEDGVSGNDQYYMFKTQITNQCAVLVQGDYTLGAVGDADNVVNADNIHLIVATGNVTVETDFAGLIICGGKVTILNGAKIAASPEKTAMVFQCIYSNGVMVQETVSGQEKTVSPMSFFKEGEQYLLNGIASGYIVETFGEQINVSDYIKFANWKKQ